MSSSTHVLTRAAFVAWLRTKHPRTKAGLVGVSTSCPLAKFLMQTTGVPHCVNEKYYVPRTVVDDNLRKVRKLPLWAQRFVQEIDNCDGRSISAGRALRIIENIY